MNSCDHGVSLAVICDRCKGPSAQELLGELMDAAGVYNDGSTPKVLWGRCIAQVKDMRVSRGTFGRSWS